MATTSSEQSLRAAQALVGHLRAVEGPATILHPGDLAWGPAHRAGRQGPARVWFRHPGGVAPGGTVGFVWLEGGEHIEARTLPTARDLLPALLDYAIDELGARSAWVGDHETELQALLAARGFGPDQEGMVNRHLVHDLAPPPEVVLPDGYAVKAVEDTADYPERVRVHQAAWNSQNLTLDTFAAVRAAWPYRADLDWVAVAPDGRFAACCLGWLDPVSGSVLMEPVGTDPEFRRLGLAAAVCSAMLARAREVGAAAGAVNCVTEPACALYESIGFREAARSRIWGRA